MINPLEKIRKAVGNLSSGDADLTVRIPVKGNDEFSGLASDVNKFVEMLQKIIQDLNQHYQIIILFLHQVLMFLLQQ